MNHLSVSLTNGNGPTQGQRKTLTRVGILYFRIPHNTLCLLPQILHKLLFSNALGDTAYYQEHLKTMVYAKFGGQTKCIMGNSKIENYGNSIPTLVRIFLCPCVGPFPLVGLTLTWFIWVAN